MTFGQSLHLLCNLVLSVFIRVCISSEILLALPTSCEKTGVIVGTESLLHTVKMAPVGEIAVSRYDLHMRNTTTVDKSLKESDEEDYKVEEEPPDDQTVHKEVHLKVEKEVRPIADQGAESALTSIRDSKEPVVKKLRIFDSSSEDEDNKQEIDLTNGVSCKSGESYNCEMEETHKYVCKICGKYFYLFLDFKLHVKTHNNTSLTNEGTDKPHKCLECGKSFALLQHLTAHSRTHVAGRYYECPICKTKFSESSNLTMHLLKTHPDEKPYRCSKCERHFTQPSALKKHMRIHWSTEQVELDHIDEIFLIDDGTEKEIEEPIRKKMKLEGKVDEILQVQKKSPDLEIDEEKLPAMEKLLSTKFIQVGNSSAPERVNQMNTTSDVREESPAKKIDSSEIVVPSKSSISTIASSLVASDVVRLLKEPATPASVTSLILTESPAPADLESLVTQENGVMLDRASPLKAMSLEGNIKEPLKICQSKDPFGMRNGVPLDQVQSPQIKITKYEKKSNDNDVLSQEIQKMFHLPSRLPDKNEINNLVSREGKDKTETVKGPNNSNDERLSQEMLSEKKEPSVCMNNPDKNKLEKSEEEYDVRYKCHRCVIFFETEEKLHDHLMFHTGVKLFECRFCGKDFTKMSSLKKHLYFHVIGSISQDCTRCGKSFSTYRDLKDHSGINKCNPSSSARFKCFRCKKFTSSLKKLKVHLLSQCNEDPVKSYFKKLTGSNQNAESDISAPVSEDSKLLGDTESTSEISEAEKLARKSEWVNQKFEKSNDSSRLLDTEGLHLASQDIEALQVLHELNPADPIKSRERWILQCQNCCHKSENLDEAKSHSKVCSVKVADRESLKIKVVFEEDRETQCFLRCSECQKEILGVEKMLLHIKEHILEQNTLTCPVLKCEKLFKDPSEFKLHLKAHSGHKPFKCSDCGKRFFLRENFEEHAKRHGVLKNWSSLSTIIGETSLKSSAKNPAHIPSTIESSITNLEVLESDVDRKFKWTPHHTTKPICDRAEFKSLENQNKEKVHQDYRVIHKTSPAILRPAHSSVVSLSLPPQETFSIISSPRSYSPASPESTKSGFSSASSKQSISQKDSRYQYYRLTESSRGAIEAVNAELRKYPRSGRCEICMKFCSRLDKHMMVHLNQKPHLCPVCPQAFRQSEHLRRHIRAKHEGDHRQFECSHCHKRLTRKDKLKEHMKICCRSEDGGDTLGNSLFDMIPGPTQVTVE